MTTTEVPIMTGDARWLRAAVGLALILIAAACGKKADSSGDAQVPEVSTADVPDVAAGGSGDADARELARYRLTMADVRKVAAVQEKWRRLLEQHPELARDDDDAAEVSETEWLDQTQAAIERVPEARRVIREAGMDVREFLLVSMALIQAWGGQALVQQGSNPDAVARELMINPANLRFVKEHEAELAKYKRLFIETPS